MPWWVKKYYGGYTEHWFYLGCTQLSSYHLILTSHTIQVEHIWVLKLHHDDRLLQEFDLVHILFRFQCFKSHLFLSTAPLPHSACNWAKLTGTKVSVGSKESLCIITLHNITSYYTTLSLGQVKNSVRKEFPHTSLLDTTWHHNMSHHIASHDFTWHHICITWLTSCNQATSITCSQLDVLCWSD